MRTDYNVTGKERRRLAETVAKEIGVDAIYLGAPTFAYQADQFFITKDGALEFEDERGGDEAERVYDALEAAGFTPEEDKDRNGLTISIPLEHVKQENLSRLLAAKATLIKHALGVDSLRYEITDEKILFPWWDELPAPEEVRAYTKFITAICKLSKEAKRVTAKERPIENEKYAFRCFLLRLDGFIGPDAKEDRKILLRNLTGSSAFKNDPGKDGDQ